MASNISINWQPLIADYHGLQHNQKAMFYHRIKSQFFPDKSVKAVKAKFHRMRRQTENKLKEAPKPTDEQKLEIARIIMEMKERGKRRSDTPREMPTETCLQRMVNRGIIEAGFVSASHINWLLRESLNIKRSHR